MNKLKKLTQEHQKIVNQARYSFSKENIDFFGLTQRLEQCKEDNELYKLAQDINKEFLTGEEELKKYVNSRYGDFAVSDSTITNFLKYGYLRDKHTLSSRKKIVSKVAVDEIFTDGIVNLSASDFFEALDFSLKMLDKVENLSLRFGTFFDKIAKRNGTALNYIERHLIGKLGETATIKLLNEKLGEIGSKFAVENSFKTDQVEAADIVQLKDKNGVIVNTKSKVQIKAATGLNSVVLKEDKTKLESDTFAVDYCVFVQLLNSPLSFLIEFMRKLNDQFAVNKDTNLNNILQNLKLDDTVIAMSAKVSGFTHVNDMKVVEKGDKLLPLGEVTSDSYYLYVADLNRDFSYLAKQLVP